ncbi:MAG TPA: aldehyde dehydrogenase family protein [Fimbriimonadaceae bacterium]|nr:aldehyde dehydrogenase family protein [Fimbriimonadaceae bacterium]
MRELMHSIGGELVTGGEGHLPTLNPTRPEEIIGQLPLGAAEQVNAAAESALAASGSWRKETGANRAGKLGAWAEAIAGRADEIALAIATEVGKPIGESKGEVQRCVAILRYFAGEAVRPVGEVIPSLTPGALQYSFREPLGVVGLITPWNFPLAIPLWKAAPALAVGNVVILKPSEHSAWCANLLAETALAVGFKGEFQVVQGAGNTGRALTNHSAIQAISFTGSDRTGKAISIACAERGKKFQTEMGGKNVAIVLADADLKQAAQLVAGGAMRFAGQKCTATSRVVVDSSVRGPFIDELRRSIDALPVGAPESAHTAIGPVISQESQDRIRSAVNGGESIYQGQTPNAGFFVAPQVIGGVDENHDLSQQELFGPVLTLLEADSFERAIQISNHTKFGLSASLCTRDLSYALRYIDQIQAGMVRVNADTTGVDPHAPFGGYKGSSSGSREQGEVAKEFYTQIKTVQINP